MHFGPSTQAVSIHARTTSLQCAAATLATLPAAEPRVRQEASCMAVCAPPSYQPPRLKSHPHGEPALVCSLLWDKTQLNNGSFRQNVAQLGRLGHSHLHLHLDCSSMQGELPTPELIRLLGVVYDALSDIEPRIVAVPLLPCAGWKDGAVEQLSDGASVATFAGIAPAVDLAGASQHIVLPPPGEAPAGMEVIQPPIILDVRKPDVSKQASQDSQPALSSSTGQTPLLFDHVAVGGTFDRLHCGHELLLASTALVARTRAYVGVTADKLLVNKNHRELLQPYEQRRDAAVEFMQAVRPSLQVEAGALSDPQVPTQAEADPKMQAIVVSQETLPGALKINEGRAARGYTPLLILVVPVIGSKNSGSKLSSTQLRAQDAAAADQAGN